MHYIVIGLYYNDIRRENYWRPLDSTQHMTRQGAAASAREYQRHLAKRWPTVLKIDPDRGFKLPRIPAHIDPAF